MRLADGLATPDEHAEAVRAGVDVADAVAVRQVLAEVLAPSGLGVPDGHAATNRTLAAAGLDDGNPGRIVRAALDAGGGPELADVVFRSAGLDTVPPSPGQIAAAHRSAAGRAPAIAPPVLARTHAGAVDLGGPLKDALAGGTAPELGDAVLGPWDLGPALREALDGGRVPDLTQDICAALDLDPVASGLGAAVRDAAGPAPDLGDTVLESIEDGPTTSPVGAALAAMAGEPPEMWDAVAGEIGAVRSAGRMDKRGASPLRAANARRRRAPRRWWLPAAGVAVAAAAAVLAVVGLPSDRASDGQGALAGHIHLESGHAEIEEISAGPDAMVQVLQFDEDAPTIIFIDVLEVPAGAEGDAGVSL
ncbi:MAG: hypothetical protein VX000_12060 [Myxococcota bacterium]|nr:hypothetical protein [Myxococcota bacterium]